MTDIVDTAIKMEAGLIKSSQALTYPTTGNNFFTNLQYLQGMRVLVVDSNDDFCQMITVLLQLYGVEVVTASLTQQALEKFVFWQPDMIISDIALPHEDGCALIKQLRTKAGERGKVVLAIAVTSYDIREIFDLEECVGFDLLFRKPLDIDEFLTVLTCLAICQQSSYTIAQKILGVGHKDTNR